MMIHCGDPCTVDLLFLLRMFGDFDLLRKLSILLTFVVINLTLLGNLVYVKDIAMISIKSFKISLFIRSMFFTEVSLISINCN